MDGILGFEPRFTGSKPAVLPLDDIPINYLVQDILLYTAMVAEGRVELPTFWL